MTRLLAILPSLLGALLLVGIRPSFWMEALVAGLLGGGSALLAAVLLPGSLNASHERFLKAFGIVFASQAAGFLALALGAWKGPWAGAPLLALYAAGAVGGTLVVGLTLQPKEPGRVG